MNDAKFAVRSYNPVIEIIGLTLPLHRSEIRCIYCRTVIRMHIFHECLKGICKFLPLDTKYAICLIGTPEDIVYEVVFPTAKLGNPLRFVQQDLLHEFPLCDIHFDTVP